MGGIFLGWGKIKLVFIAGVLSGDKSPPHEAGKLSM